MTKLFARALLLVFILSTPSAHAGTVQQLRFDGGLLNLPSASPWGKLSWTDRCGSSSRMCAEATAGSSLFYLLGGRVTAEEARAELACEPGATKDVHAQLCIRKEGESLTVMKRLGSVAVAISITPAPAADSAAIRSWMSAMTWEGRQ